MTSLIKQNNIPKATLIIYYQGFLAVAAILVFFTKLDVYLEIHTPMIPLHWMIIFLVASLPLFLNIFNRIDRISTNLLIWSGAYTAVSLTSILIHPELPDQQYLEDQIRTIIFLCLMLTVFAYHPLVTKWIKLAILSATLFNVFLYVYEFLNPAALYVEQISPGRSSGFYSDSNSAGISLALGMILTIDMIKPKYRLFYALFIFIGIATTFSRGSIAGWVLVVSLFIVSKVIPRYQIPLLSIFIVMMISILSTQLSSLKYIKTADGTELFREDTLARVEFLIDPLAQKDGSQASRLDHIMDAWYKFEKSPFIGNGLGAGKSSTALTPEGKAQRSHNTYLDLMVEYGFLGALIFPSLLLACSWKVKGQFAKQSAAFAFFILFQGFFSHTLLSEFWSLTTYPIVANLTRHSSQVSQKLSEIR